MQQERNKADYPQEWFCPHSHIAARQTAAVQGDYAKARGRFNPSKSHFSGHWWMSSANYMMH